MNRSFSIVAVEPPPLSLRAIAPRDLEDLRIWKNANRESFFFKGEITPEGQRGWFEDYLARSGDYMFLVEAGPLRVGCMGFRLIAGAIDAYNIIGAPEARGRGLMTRAMALMCCYAKAAHHASQVGCKVLKCNPAAGWYQKIGYRIAADREDYYEMALDLASLEPVPYVVEEVAR